MPALSKAPSRMVLVTALAALSLLLFCWCYQRWSPAAWRVPLNYSGDSLFSMMLARTFASGGPPWQVTNAGLNAPFTADLNDYPVTEKLPNYAQALLTRWLPPGAASNVTMWLAHATAVLGFFAAARLRGARRWPAAAGGLLFGFSNFVLSNAHGFAGLAFCGHVPLLFVLLNRTLQPGPRTRADWVRGALLVLLFAFMSPYFGLFLFFALAAAAVVFALRGEPRSALFPAALATAFLMFFLLNHAGFFLTLSRQGANPEAVYRTLAHLDLWGLRLPDLVWPAAHPWAAWSRFAATHYFGRGAPLTEATSAFLGLAGLLSVAWMALQSAAAVARRRVETVSVEAWVALLALAFAVGGGLNYLLGSCGFMLLRGTNRYSVVILCAGLLHLARGPLTRRPLAGGLLAAALLLLQAWEMTPLRSAAPATRDRIALTMASDQKFTRTLETALPRAALVFQLPVMYFPENGPLEVMGDYEHFRPYLWSESLRFSYGGCKGRVREAWQRRAAAQPAPDLVRELQSYGFSALYLNRRGFADRAVQLENDLRALGLPVVAEAEQGDLIAYRLVPESPARRPYAGTAINAGSGFLLPPHAPTLDRLWASGNAQLILQRGDAQPPLFDFFCHLTAEDERTVQLRTEGQILETYHVRPNEPVTVHHILPLEQPVSSLYFQTSPGPRVSDAGPYLVAFALSDIQLRAISTGLWPGTGFHPFEMTSSGQPFAWSTRSDHAELVAVQAPGQPPATSIRLGLHGLCLQRITIADQGAPLWSGAVTPGQITWVELPLPAAPAVHTFTVTSDQPPRRLSRKDARTSAFAVYEPQLLPVAGSGP